VLGLDVVRRRTGAVIRSSRPPNNSPDADPPWSRMIACTMAAQAVDP